MANSAQARKRARQNNDQRFLNAGHRSAFRTHVKKVLKAVQTGDKTQAQEAFKIAESSMDRVADKGIIHKNKAARLKSRLSARIKALSASA